MPVGIERRGPQMTIEIIVFLGLVFAATAVVAKVYERRQDVLYGPYIQGRNLQRPLQNLVARLAQALAAIGLRQHWARIGWKVWHVCCLASAII
jgi:hypothetical protein